MATFLKIGDQVLNLDAVTAATYSPPSATSHAGIKLLVSGHWIQFDAGGEAIWQRLLVHLNPEDLATKATKGGATRK